MENLERHRSSLFDTFAAQFEQLWKALQEELSTRKERERELLNEIHTLKYNHHDVKRLRQENSRLRSHIEHVESKDAPGQEEGSLVNVEAVSSTCNTCSCDASKDLIQMVNKYEHLTRKYATVFEAYKVLRTRWDEQKENRDRWKAYAKWHSEHTAKKKRRDTLNEDSMPSPLGSTTGQQPSPVPPNLDINTSLPPSPRLCPLRDVFDSVSPQGSCHSKDGKQQKTVADRQTSHAGRRGNQEIRTSVEPSLQDQKSNDVIPSNATKASGNNKPGEEMPEPTEREREISMPQEKQPLAEKPLPPQTARSSSDEPVVVSERNLKRKRDELSDFGATQEEVRSTVEKRRIKHEQEPSSPIDLDNILPYVGEPESLDLDEVGQKVATPRKPRRSLRASQASRWLQNRGLSIVTQHDSLVEDMQRSIKSESSQGDHSSNRQATQEASQFMDYSHLSSLTSQSPDTQFDQENIEIRAMSEPPVSSQIHHTQSARRREWSFDSPLKQKCMNIRVRPTTSTPDSPRSTRSRKQKESSNASRVAVIAEDGEKHGLLTPEKPRGLGEKPKSSTRSSNLDGSGAKENLYRRLDALLDDQTPSKKVLLQNNFSGLPRTSAIHPPRRARVSSDAQFETPLRAQSPSSDTRSGIAEQDNPDNEPFRSRGVHRLGLEHFKINPNYNQGLDYAFNETVRNREQRSCLPGCTKPECCGVQFRKLVQIGGDSMSAEEEKQLLEDYLGNDRRSLEYMSQREMQELLLQAKSKLLADKHGKHREAYERRATPPGFWRTDMPTTQEIEEDREEARRVERDKVEERYREALRPGGKYIFRDEKP